MLPFRCACACAADAKRACDIKLQTSTNVRGGSDKHIFVMRELQRLRVHDLCVIRGNNHDVGCADSRRRAHKYTSMRESNVQCIVFMHNPHTRPITTSDSPRCVFASAHRSTHRRNILTINRSKSIRNGCAKKKRSAYTAKHTCKHTHAWHTRTHD